MKKFLRIFVKTIVGFLVFYLIAGFIILPLAAAVVIPWQGSRLLQTPVKVRSVFLNPLTLQLWINGLRVLDQDQDSVLGFEKLFLDISFTDLFKKTFRIESIRLDGLDVRAVLLPNGTINILSLLPEQMTDSADTADSPGATEAQETEDMGPPPPLIMADKIALREGAVRFEDQTVQPAFSTVLNDITIDVTGFSTQPESETRFTFNAALDRPGIIYVEARLKPLRQPLQAETAVNLNNYALRVLTPYIGKYTGRELADGKLDLKLTYRIGDNQLTAEHKLLIQHFEFGQKVQSPDALSLPFGLAVALLEDPQGKIDISLPVKGDLDNPQFEYLPLLGQVVRDFFVKLVTKPFSVMASLIGGAETGTEELGQVRFEPGQTVLKEAEKDKLKKLLAGLKKRPRLRLEINGSYDPEIDWRAIQADIFERDFSRLRTESTEPDTDVYQLLYQRRFGIRGLWQLTKKYKEGIGEYEHKKINQEIKRQLIEDAPPDPQALKELANARAKTVYDFFVEAGFDEQRLTLGSPQTTQSSMGAVPLEFTLTIFDNRDDDPLTEEEDDNTPISSPDTISPSA